MNTITSSSEEVNSDEVSDIRCEQVISSNDLKIFNLIYNLPEYGGTPKTLFAVANGRSSFRDAMCTSILVDNRLVNFWHHTEYNSCNKYYIFYSRGLNEIFIFCKHCYIDEDFKEWIFKFYNYYEENEVLYVHVHLDGHFHCMKCSKDTCNYKECKKFRQYDIQEITQLWYTV